MSIYVDEEYDVEVEGYQYKLHLEAIGDGHFFQNNYKRKVLGLIRHYFNTVDLRKVKYDLEYLEFVFKDDDFFFTVIDKIRKFCNDLFDIDKRLYPLSHSIVQCPYKTK